MTGVNLTRIKRETALNRLQQAGALVRRVKVIREPELPPVQVRAYVARRELTSEAENIEPGGFVAIEAVALHMQCANHTPRSCRACRVCNTRPMRSD